LSTYLSSWILEDVSLVPCKSSSNGDPFSAHCVLKEPPSIHLSDLGDDHFFLSCTSSAQQESKKAEKKGVQECAMLPE
jgi:hypothetical protein